MPGAQDDENEALEQGAQDDENDEPEEQDTEEEMDDVEDEDLGLEIGHKEPDKMTKGSKRRRKTSNPVSESNDVI